jgi:uncharacterized tellurite resistance protein B-like protein
MLDRIRKFLISHDNAAPAPDELQTAVAVLLIEAARMDDHFDEAERSAIERLLAERFDLSPEATRELMRLAEDKAENSHQYHPFTRLTVERMDPRQRVKLIEMLWEVAYADGVVDPDEEVLVRRIAGLIYVSDEDRVGARHRVLSRLQQKPES